MVAILDEAIRCSVLRRGAASVSSRYSSRTRLALDARAWFDDDSDDRVFSFISICSVLGLDWRLIRKRLQRLKRAPGARKAILEAAPGDGAALALVLETTDG